MKIFFFSTFCFLASPVTASNIVPTEQDFDTQDVTTRHLMEKATASGNAELRRHLNAFSDLKREAAFKAAEDGVDQAHRHLHGSSKKECFYGHALEAFVGTYTAVDSDQWPQGTNIYWWGTSAVCSAQVLQAPMKPYAYKEIRLKKPNWCGVENGRSNNAPGIGSATGNCFISPVRMKGDFGPYDDLCGGSGSPCQWSCEETLVINNNGRDDYLFLTYIFKPATEIQAHKFPWVSVGDFPKRFEVIVTSGTGCYNLKNGPVIINGYTNWNNNYYVYDLEPLGGNGKGKSSKSSKSSKSPKSLQSQQLETETENVVVSVKVKGP